MNFLAMNKTTRALLGEWAKRKGSKTVIMSRFLFWKLGIGEQKEIRGLVRSLLYEALKEVADVARIPFPRH
jgi:hypothetical protein